MDTQLDLSIAAVIKDPQFWDKILGQQNQGIDRLTCLSHNAGMKTADLPLVSPRHQFIYTSADASRLYRNDRSPAI
jgi:hypothetical protein